MDRPTQALMQCDARVRTVDEDRYLAALFAKPEQRQDLCALYAFNHEIAKIRDVISEPMLGEIRLQWWREALEEIYEKDHVRRNETVQALDFVIKAYDLPRQPFDALIDARTFDLYNEPMATLDQLEDYLGATAGGLMSLAMRIAAPAIDVSEDQIRGLGIAWGSIGLLRALTIHSQRRQLYLPLELLTKHQIDLEDVLSGKAGEGLAGICDDVLTRTKSHLKNSKHDLASDGLPAVLYVRLIRAYARLIEGNSRDLFNRDLKLSPLKKRLSLLMGNLTGTI